MKSNTRYNQPWPDWWRLLAIASFVIGTVFVPRPNGTVRNYDPSSHVIWGMGWMSLTFLLLLTRVKRVVHQHEMRFPWAVEALWLAAQSMTLICGLALVCISTDPTVVPVGPFVIRHMIECCAVECIALIGIYKFVLCWRLAVVRTLRTEGKWVGQAEVHYGLAGAIVVPSVFAIATLLGNRAQVLALSGFNPWLVPIAAGILALAIFYVFALDPVVDGLNGAPPSKWELAADALDVGSRSQRNCFSRTILWFLRTQVPILLLLSPFFIALALPEDALGSVLELLGAGHLIYYSGIEMLRACVGIFCFVIFTELIMVHHI